ncbi:efflux RND transporter periplasmic adaptor subunit [Larkinella sp. C7]|uniref:efflux RND transporter periplasmic adaptor subunit n=1 Tax=Larkinella sp. C7 TaxID=2576607 RepID=UPI0011114F89|nr:efflux RND transporter periplasmic adaptor subunit [Larkinella sp. C7]
MNDFKKLGLRLVFGLGLLTACNRSPEKADDDTVQKDSTQQTAPPDRITFSKDQYTMASIQTGKVESRHLSSLIKVNGMIDVEPSSVVTISAPLGGYVKSAGLLPGQAIRKGQVIATLENPEFINIQEQYLESSSRLTLLQQEYERQLLLRKQDVNAAKTLQQVTSDLQVMQARVSALEAKITMAGISKKGLNDGKISASASLYAPMTGYVKTSNVNIGKYVNPTDVLFELANKNALHLALNVFEKDIDQIRVSQSIRFGLGSDPQMNRRATVFLIGQATAENRMIPVHCHFPKSMSQGLLPGMYVKAWIEKAGQTVPVLPLEAIVQSEGKDYIFRQVAQSDQGFTYQMIPVKKGIQQDNLTEVILPSTVSAQDAIIVTKGAYAILSALINAGEEE